MHKTLILDSGAFSAWSRGQSIDIDNYIAFIFANAEHVDYYVNLDVIPGSFGVVPSAREVEVSAQASWDNLLYMEAHGLKPMPVFHMGERFYWLRKMIEHKCDYIGISPANDRTTQQKRMWLDRVFTEIGDEEGRPVVKTHALGVTAVPLLIRYPWFSADSSAWATATARGVIYVPRVKNRAYDYTQSPLVVYMSDVREQSDDAKDYRSMTPDMRRFVEAYVKEAGTTIEQVKESCVERARVCAYFFKKFEELQLEPAVFKPHHSVFFEDD